MIRILLISMLSLLLMSCATINMKKQYVSAALEQGKRDFNEGYYKRAMRELLPLGCDGHREAQYAIGYMYYYGLGVAQDTDVGYFWIKRSADQHFLPAIKALQLIERSDKAISTPHPPAL